MTEGSNPQTQAIRPTPVSAKKLRRSPLVVIVRTNGSTGCEVCIDFRPPDCVRTHSVPAGRRNDGYGRINGIGAVAEATYTGYNLRVMFCPWEALDTEMRDKVSRAAA